MKTLTKIFWSAGLMLFATAYATPYGIECTKPVISSDIQNHVPVGVQFQCANNTGVTFNNVRFTVHQLVGKAPVNFVVNAIPTLASGSTATVTGSVTATQTDHYEFDLDALYAGEIHAGIFCKNQASAQCININSSDPGFLGISDIHLAAAASSTDYGKDTDPALWEAAKKELSSLIVAKHPKFVIVLGDLPAHHDDNNRPANLFAVLKGLRQTVGSVPTFYVPGNNDSLGGDYHSFTEHTDHGDLTPLSLDPGVSTQDQWPALNVGPIICSNQTPPSDLPCLIDPETGRQFGYYSAKVDQHLRLIVLNSVIFTGRYISDDGVDQQTAADQEIEWLDEQLSDAQKASDSVMIAMHVPTGLDVFSGTGARMWAVDESKFNNLVKEYAHTIKGIITGHTHADEMHRFELGNSLVALDISIPGLTPQHFNNPAMRYFYYDSISDDFSDLRTYYTNPQADNFTPWNSYDFRADYHCAAGSILSSCIQNLSLQDSGTQSQYEQNYSVRNPGYTLPSTVTWQDILNAIDIRLNT